MDIKEIPIQLREKTGSAESRRLRRKGLVPGVLYGLGKDPVSLVLESRVFSDAFEAGSRVFDLKLEGREQICLLKEVQMDALGTTYVHVDFQRVNEEAPVTVTVAINYIGQPETVAHAFLEFPQQDVEVRCLPRRIPAHIDLNLSGMQVGTHVEAGDLELPEGVELVTAPTAVVATYHFKHAPAAETPAGEEEGAAEPEVLTEKKPESEE